MLKENIYYLIRKLINYKKNWIEIKEGNIELKLQLTEKIVMQQFMNLATMT